MQAVVQVPSFDPEPPRPWPVAPMAPWSWLALDDGCTDEEVGLFVAGLAHRLDVQPPAGRDEVVTALLAEELLIVAGGLRVADTVTGMTVVPGCCAGLEDWQDWAQVLTGVSPWLGHDPGPGVEVDGGDLRVWQDGGPDRYDGQWAQTSIVMSRQLLPDLLRKVQQDLVGFLAALAAWTERMRLGESGPVLVEAVDRNFTITVPLALPKG